MRSSRRRSSPSSRTRSWAMAWLRSATRARSARSRERTIESRIEISICRQSRSRVAVSRSSAASTWRWRSFRSTRVRSGSTVQVWRAVRSRTATSCSICWARTFRIRAKSASSLCCSPAARSPSAGGVPSGKVASSGGRPGPPKPLTVSPGAGRGSPSGASLPSPPACWACSSSNSPFWAAVNITQASTLSGSLRSEA